MKAILMMAAALTAATGLMANPAGSRPNVILMVADDMGWADPGFNGGDPALTPNVDRLAREGTRLTQFYMHSVCAPSRGALLTGRYAFRLWMDWRSEDFGKPSYLEKLGMKLAHLPDGTPTRRIHALDTKERTIAEALREAGYFTAIMGKWHCGEWLPEHLPMGQGFDHQYGHYGWGIDYTNYTIPHNAPARFAVYDWHRNQKPVFEQGYATDLIANEVVRMLAEQSRERPFFYYVPFNAVHGPHESIPRYTEKYDKRNAALKCMDDAVGRIVDAVDQYGFQQNTLVIFTNDNGGLRQEMNRPYRGTKNTTYEGGVRVPTIWRWPGKLPGGASNDGMMHVTDLFNTIVSLAGGSLKQDRPLDGMDMTKTIFDGAPSPRDEIAFEVAGSVRLPTIRKGDFKLMGDKLYNVVKDPGESTDVADQHPQVVAALKSRLAKLSAERGKPNFSSLLLMTPALPYVYGREENANAPVWVKSYVEKIRATQPQEWAPGTTPWPQAPKKTGEIIYTGDGR